MKIDGISLPDISGTAYWYWDVPSDRVQLSDQFLSIAGLSNDFQSISVNKWADLFIEEHREDVKKSLLNYLKTSSGNSLEFSAHCNIKDQQLCNLTVSGDVVERDKTGDPVRISGQISVSPVQTEQDYKDFSDSYLLNLLLKRLPYSIYFKDRKSRFIRISDECARKFGLHDANDAIKKTDFDFFDSEHAEDAYNDEQEILKTGKPLIGKLEKESRQQKNSKASWASTTKLPMYDSNNNPVGTFGITNDVTARIEAEEALKKSEQKYRSIFENIHDVYYRTDRNGIVTEISPSIEKYSGYKKEDVIGKPVSNFYVKQSERNELIEQLKKNGFVTDFEIRLANLKDEFVHTSVSAKIIHNEEGEAVAVEGIMRDITERKKADSKLKDAHNFYTQILSNTSEGIYVVDAEMKYIFWNAMMEKISGYNESFVLGKTPGQLFNHINQLKIVDSIRDALKGKTSKSGDYYYEIPETGKSGWVQAFYKPLRNKEGEIENALVAISNITDRKHAEQKLRKSDETLTKLSEQVPGAIYQFQQFADGRSCFPFASKAFHYVYELYPEEVKNDAAPVLDRIYHEDREKVISSINKSFNTLDYWELDYRVNLPNRGLRWLRGKARPEKHNDGSVIWHGYISDITDKKQKEHELNRTMDIVSDQNSRLLNFAHIVSHNLRNHAGNISSLLSLYEEENSEDEKAQLLDYLGLASDRLNESIQDLNHIIDQQSGSGSNISRLNLYQYFCKIKEILSTDIIIKNVSFDVNIPEGFELDYNPSYLESILLNLVSNAIKYSHPDRLPVISVSLDIQSGHPLLTVKDNGVGIDLARYGSKLFGMYNTFHENRDSKGIGLYITKNQVESMGGVIEVESEVGKGTQFKVTLNCTPSGVERAS